MKLEDFSYSLPATAIAQTPLRERDRSRMLVMEAATGRLCHRIFKEISEYFHDGDVVVINDSRVIPARLTGRKESGGLIEILLLSKNGKGCESEEDWDALLKPAKRLRKDAVIHLPGNARATVMERLSEKKWRLRFSCPNPVADFMSCYGRAPLPPYIKRPKGYQDNAYDLDRYQTIYARAPGSVAAPTAGFHFSVDVIGAIRNSGARIAPVTLHVGYGTFLPIETTDIEDHEMEAEYYEISPESADIINSAERIIAVGTTATRVIESAADEHGRVAPSSGWTSLYIYPGYRFKRVRALLTNFHLPKSSLYLLTCAFGGKQAIGAAYEEAIKKGYRFYSYGDCMLIL